jgi:cyclophilin family peptidyl-prolyl cis-trans isomerase
VTLNMMKKILAASISAALLGLPAAAPAQDAETEAVEQAPASAVQHSINYDVTADPDNVWLLDLSNGERVAIRLMPGWAPNHVERVKTLTRTGFYDGVIFHRVIDGFMAQGGDPTGTGQGGSAMPDLEEEFNPRPHIRGTVSMARATDENSANSQFFIVFYPRFSLDKRYTNFGRVISNMDGVDTITRGEPPANPTRILQASIASDNKPQLFPQPEAPVEEEITADLLSAPLN